MPTPTLQREFAYYLAHQSELAARFAGRVLVIKGEQLIGDYANEGEAILEASKSHEPGTFLVQRCDLGKKNYTQSFHSRVAFA